MNSIIHKSAVFSPCRTWRYTLTRTWDFTRPLAMFVGLNPSTATETIDDNTVRRCIGYARNWGYGGLLMMNIFAFRAKDPKVMKSQEDPVGPGNNCCLVTMAHKESTGIVVAAWGTHGVFQNRHQNILKLFLEVGIPLHCLRITKKGFPEHPLFLPGKLEPIPFTPL